MFNGTEKAIAGAVASPSIAALNGESAGDFAELAAKLSAVSQLLVVPTPGSVYQVSLMLEDVQGRMARLNREAGRRHPDQVRTLQGELGRVRTLVEGAMRVQWTQMRAVMALTQSYSPGGRVSHWQPPLPKVDLKV
jgi:hypothetical protein